MADLAPHTVATGLDEEWKHIQAKTFTNWVNEQLSVSGRAVRDLGTDLCDGVNLVSLVEALQFRKIGKVYTKATSKFQRLQNVSLALKAIQDDNIKLVNLGSDDIVNGNQKLILGLVWHLIQRYQLSGKKTKAPPKKLMRTWFRALLPDMDITNFTSDWSDGILLHALLERLKPGISPNWRSLSRNDRIDNCRRAMVLAKEQLNIPRVISAEDFTNAALDELSSMTYLSYFVRMESPGYYHTLNWVCKQLRTTTITNLTTDWNDGYYLCAIVTSLGGEIPGWPNLDRQAALDNCQKGIDGSSGLGVEPLLTARELADPHVDHLSVMTYLSRLQTITPRKGRAEKITVHGNFDTITAGTKAEFQLEKGDSDVDVSKVTVTLVGPTQEPDCGVVWSHKRAACTFHTLEMGAHKLNVHYDGVQIKGCPIEFLAKGDHTKAKLMSMSSSIKLDQPFEINVDTSGSGRGEVIMESTSPNGELRFLTSIRTGDSVSAVLVPKDVGAWKVHVYFDDDELQGSPVDVVVYDPRRATLDVPQDGIVGQLFTYTVNCAGAGDGDVASSVTHDGSDVSITIVQDREDPNIYTMTFTPEMEGHYNISAAFNDCDINGSPKLVILMDPTTISVTGEGITQGVKGDDCSFRVDASGVGGSITANVEVDGRYVDVTCDQVAADIYNYTYRPTAAGEYSIQVLWNGRHVPGSPFEPSITDRSRVVLADDLAERMDENDHLALECGEETTLNYSIANAGPGTFSAEVLSPDGRLPVDVRKPEPDTVQVGFTAKVEGDHYIHLYWSQLPLDRSPILAYCPGPVLPINHALVVVTGDGCQSARATVPAEFMIDGKKAGPGIPRVRMNGVRTDVDVEMRAMKYDRYKCKYSAPAPGGYLLNVEWSGSHVPGSPFKVSITMKGHSDKVKVEGQGLRGGYVGQELRAVVDTSQAGNGEVTAECHGKRHTARCDLIRRGDSQYVLRMFPTEAHPHTLSVRYDGEHVTGSPFRIPVGEPPEPRKVRVYGPGIEAGTIQTFESKFIVETYGAGSGQLSVRVRGPRSAFKVEMLRDREDERTILCRYDPGEAGEYVIHVTWSGVQVPGSPFAVNIFESREALIKHVTHTNQIELIADYQWKEEI